VASEAGRANYADLKVRLQSSLYDQRAAVTRSETAEEQARNNRDKENNSSFDLKLEPEISLRDSISTWKQRSTRSRTRSRSWRTFRNPSRPSWTPPEWDRQVEGDAGAQTELATQLTVHAGTEGVVQEMTLQVGQQIAIGAVLAKVVQPWRLQAELKIARPRPRTSCWPKAMIDTRNGIITGPRSTY